MGEESSTAEPQQSFFKKHWEGYKEFWGERFSFLQNYSKMMDIQERHPSWSTSDLDEFAASDPVYGPQIKACMQTSDIAFKGSVIGATSSALVAWKYSRSLHGAGLSFLAGGVFGWTFGQEIASHWLQLYRMDTVTAQVKFFEWWEKKNERQS